MLKNTVYRVTHSYVVLGGITAAAFVCAMFLRLDFRGAPAVMLLRDPRPAVWCSLAVVAAVLIYDDENRIPAAAASRGISRAGYYLSRAAACFLLAAVAYILTVAGAAVWAGSGMTGDFLAETLKTLPFCLAATGFVLLIAAALRSMIAYVAAAALLAFVLWNGLGADAEWLRTVFPPYMQLARELTGGAYAVCAGWVVCSTAVGAAVAMRRNLK